MVKALVVGSIIALVGCNLQWGQYHGSQVDAAADGSLGRDAEMVDADVAVDAAPDAMPLSSARELTSFGFMNAQNSALAFDVTATITGTKVDVTVPAGTNVTALTATFTTTGVSVTVAGVVQTSQTTSHDFTSPVIYRVTAADASTRDYTVTVKVAAGLVFAKTDIATGAQPMFLATADVNRDGRPDLAITTAGTPAITPGSVSVVLDTTAATDTTPSFSAGATYLANANPGSIAFADINGDGSPDLVATTSPSCFSVLLDTTAVNATTPSFAAPVAFGSGGGNALAIADVNRDGKPDVLVVGGSSLSVFLNTTAANAMTPTFAAASTFATGSVPFAIAVGDINGDGALDVAVANESDNTVSIFRNTTAANATTASFATRVDFVTGPGTFPAPYSVAIADIDGDGRLDLAVANAFQTVSTVSVFLDTTASMSTTITFAPKLDVSTGTGPECVALTDLDKDGKPELVTANTGSGTVSVFRDTTPPSAAAPTFAPKQDFSIGASPRYLVAADFDGDGTQDLAIANQGSGSVSILLGR